MAWNLISSRSSASSVISRVVRSAWSPVAAAAIAVSLFAPVATNVGAEPAPSSSATAASHLMCGWRADQRTQTVAIDPSVANAGVTVDDVIASFEPWNKLFDEYYGMPIFAPAAAGQSADIVITGTGYKQTWVDTRCSSSFKAVGSANAVVYLGPNDTWRNKDMLSHEIGHALGFADHGTDTTSTAGHIGYKPCGNYIGVMSYCSSAQNWFMDGNVKGFYVDGNLVRDYWN